MAVNMLNQDNIEDGLKRLAYEFFYRFSRFEFALKENGCLRAGPYGIAEANWDAFVKANEQTYNLPATAKELLESPPDVQRYKNQRLWEWAPLNFKDGLSDLAKLVLVVKTVRNNLFHGGKHNAKGWDEPVRVQFLLSRGIDVLDELAAVAGYMEDYKRMH